MKESIRVLLLEDNLNDDGDSKDAHALCQGTRHQEKRGGKELQTLAKTVLNELVGRK